MKYLDVIATSPTDIQPVLDAIVARAHQGCDEGHDFVNIRFIERNVLRPEGTSWILCRYLRAGMYHLREWYGARAMSSYTVIQMHVEDMYEAEGMGFSGYTMPVEIGLRGRSEELS